MIALALLRGALESGASLRIQEGGYQLKSEKGPAMLFLVSSRDQEKPTLRELFDLRFTPASLEKRLQEHMALFNDDGNGGLVCGQCSLPAVYRTLCLKVRVGRRSVDKETTRPLPICLRCQGWDEQVAHLCLTTEEAVARKIIGRKRCQKVSVAEIPERHA